LIAAAPKEVVDKYLSVVEKAGLLPVSLEVESQSMTRSLFETSSQENVLIVDIGTDHTNLVMIEQGTLQFSSSIPVGGSAFTNTIAKFLSDNRFEEQGYGHIFADCNTGTSYKSAILQELEAIGEDIRQAHTIQQVQQNIL
jgi:Tfp pilus assembly PilM family ATPase